jgi:dihydrodipicolinate synthase/N-acetylneuraminate lyase
MASIRNLDSYRAWDQEAVRRSGFTAIVSVVAGVTPLLMAAILLLEPRTKGAQALHFWLMPVGAAFAVYLLVAFGLTAFAVLRLRAWKRDHPWEPPPSPIWK